MRFLKVFSFVLCFLLVLSLCGCGKDDPTVDDPVSSEEISSEEVSSEPDPEPVFAVNPLTGEKTLNPDKVGVKPVAVMINNLSQAQGVQAGLDQADIVFETEVEGGITRLMAVFADVSSVSSSIGTVRSARVVYTDLACGLDAFYVHSGMDPDYCKSHLGSIRLSRLDLSSKNYGFRVSNGLASEHTLYTTGANLAKALEDYKQTKSEAKKPWLSFAGEDSKVTLSGGTATNIKVAFSTSYATSFLYDEASGKYLRAKNSTPYKDYVSGKNEAFSNVFVLKTDMSYYPDGKHRRVSLEGGSGYYANGGKFEEIRWRKGSSSSSFVFTKADGSTLTVSPGNSYVCIVNKTQPVTIQ